MKNIYSSITCISVILAIIACGGSDHQATTQQSPAFSSIGPAIEARRGQYAVLLSEDKVMMMWDEIAEITIYTPSTGHLEQIKTSSSRLNFTITPLANGKVLIAGGNWGVYAPSAELYDPVTGQLTPTASPMAVRERNCHTATLLPNGQVLLAGGSGQGGRDLDSAELYDPLTNRFQLTAHSMSQARSRHTAVLLLNGKVLINGGEASPRRSGGMKGKIDAEMYDYLGNSFKAISPMNAARVWHTSTLLPNGDVLIAGGNPGNEAERFDHLNEIFISAGLMQKSRFQHTATLLVNGNILLVGGIDASGYHQAQAELYETSNGIFVPTEQMISPRFDHNATLLPNGKVLIAGGIFDIYNQREAALELFDPNENYLGRFYYNTSQETQLQHGITIYPITCTGGPGYYSVLPPLPLGLRLDRSTGTISGTALFYTDKTKYSIWNSNTHGAKSAALTLSFK